MTTDVITPAEAWEEVERRRIDISPSRSTSEFCASVSEPKFAVGWGSEPLEAVANLLQRLGRETAEQVKEVAHG